jgi:hypothetical protein
MAKVYNRRSNMLDSDDRRVLGQGAVIVVASVALVITAATTVAAAAGLAWRVFGILAG